jgi:hypothetical protein
MKKNRNIYISVMIEWKGFNMMNTTNTYRGPGSSVGIATGYGLDGPGIESQWG